MTSIGLNITQADASTIRSRRRSAAAVNIGLNFAADPALRHHGRRVGERRRVRRPGGDRLSLLAALLSRPLRSRPARARRRRPRSWPTPRAGRCRPWTRSLGVLVRGTTVVVVMAAGLWVGGFFRPDELRVLERLRRSRAHARQPGDAAGRDDRVRRRDRGDGSAGRTASHRATAEARPMTAPSRTWLALAARLRCSRSACASSACSTGCPRSTTRTKSRSWRGR